MAHITGGKTVVAHQRGDLLERRPARMSLTGRLQPRPSMTTPNPINHQTVRNLSEQVLKNKARYPDDGPAIPVAAISRD